MSKSNKTKKKMEVQNENNSIEMDTCSESEARNKPNQSVCGPTITPSNEVYHLEPSNVPYNNACFINVAQSFTDRQECAEINCTEELKPETVDFKSQFDSNIIMKIGEDQALDCKETHCAEKRVNLTQEVIGTHVVMKEETSGLSNDKNVTLKQIPDNFEVNEIHANSSEKVSRNETETMQIGGWFQCSDLRKGVIGWFKQFDLLTKCENYLFFSKTLRMIIDEKLVFSIVLFAVREHLPWDYEPFIRLILNEEQKEHFLVREDFRLATFGYYSRNNIPGPVVLKLATQGYFCEPDGTIRCSECYVELPLIEIDICVVQYRCCHMHRHENISIENHYGHRAPDWILGDRQNQNDRTIRGLRYQEDIVLSTTANPELTQTGQMQSLDFQEESGVFSLHRERILRSGLNSGPMIDLQANRDIGFTIQESGSVTEHTNVQYRDAIGTTRDLMNNMLINYLRENPGGILNTTPISTVTGQTNLPSAIDNEQTLQQEPPSTSRQIPAAGELDQRLESMTNTANEQMPEVITASNQRYSPEDETCENTPHGQTEGLFSLEQSNEQQQQQQQQQKPVNSEVNQSSQQTANAEHIAVETILPSSRMSCESCKPPLSRRQDGSHFLRSRSPTNKKVTHLQKEKKYQQKQENTEIQESEDFDSLHSLATTALHPEEQQLNRTSAAITSNHTIDNERIQQQDPPSVSRQIPAVAKLDLHLESVTDTANEQMPEGKTASIRTCGKTAHGHTEGLFSLEQSNEQQQQQQHPVNSETNCHNLVPIQQQKDNTEIRETEDFVLVQSIASAALHPEEQQTNRISAAEINSKNQTTFPTVESSEHQVDGQSQKPDYDSFRGSHNLEATAGQMEHLQKPENIYESASRFHGLSEAKVRGDYQQVSVAIAAQKSPGLKQTSLMTSENHMNQGPHNDKSLKPTDTGSFQSIRKRHLSQPTAYSKNSEDLPSDCGNTRRRRLSESIVNCSWSDENVEDISTPWSEIRKFSPTTVQHSTTIPLQDDFDDDDNECAFVKVRQKSSSFESMMPLFRLTEGTNISETEEHLRIMTAPLSTTINNSSDNAGSRKPPNRKRSITV